MILRDRWRGEIAAGLQPGPTRAGELNDDGV